MELPPDWVEFLESGVSLLLGTCDRAMRPECVRAVGARVEEGRRVVSVLVAEAVGARTLANAQPGAAVALTASRPVNHRTVQIKGTVLENRPGTAADRLVAEHYLAAFTESLCVVGIPRAVTRQLRVWPASVLRISVQGLFDQTPGPRAGEPVEVRP